MWTVIYLSQSFDTARKLAAELYDNGVISRLRRAGAEKDASCYEVLVPDTEMEAAQDLIIENDLF